jgi:hypothetical protein
MIPVKHDLSNVIKSINREPTIKGPDIDKQEGGVGSSNYGNKSKGHQ